LSRFGAVRADAAQSANAADANHQAFVQYLIGSELNADNDGASDESCSEDIVLVCVHDATMIKSRKDLYAPSVLRRLKDRAEDREHQRHAADADTPAEPLVRLLTHIAYFDNSDEPHCFIKIFNDSDNESMQIDEVWFDTDPMATVDNPQRALPTILDAGDLFETWKRLHELQPRADLLTLGRSRLGNGAVIHSVHNIDVPPAGQVGGGGRPLDEVHVDRSRANSADPETWDAFISYATEDRSDVASPLAERLQSCGLSVWLDELELGIGASLRRGIDRGIARSAFAVVIVSPSYIAKPWTNYEFDGIVNMMVGGKQRILPIWHRVTREEVAAFSPTLVDKVARLTAEYTAAEIGDEIARLVRPDLFHA
jgi:hypothetical protein